VRPVRSVIAINRLLQAGHRLKSIDISILAYGYELPGAENSARSLVAVGGTYSFREPSTYHMIRRTTSGRVRLSEALSILIRKLEEHSRLNSDDRDTIASLNHITRKLDSNEDLIRQGDDPSVSALVTSGMVARYHLLGSGKRQYLSYHMTGDMPDSQALFIQEMDHSVCAIGPAAVALIPHKDLLAAFKRRPTVAFAIWRETLVDAAIFREAITNNSARTARGRMAHMFCEWFYRAKASSLTEGNTLIAPVSLVQLGETLGMSIATVNRTLSDLRNTRTVDFQRGVLQIKNWERLSKIAQFNPSYLHLKKAPI
jgi:CRP-like cAMP-binding protein